MHKEIEDQWHQKELEAMDEYDQKVRQRLEQDYKTKLQNQKVIKKQLHDFKMNHIKQIKNEMIEGELMKRKVQAEQEAER